MTSSLCDIIWTEKEIAEFIGIAPSTTRARGRQTDKLPPFYKPGGARSKSHKLCLRPVAEAWAGSDFSTVSKIVIDLSRYPQSLNAAQLAAALRMEPSSIPVTYCANPDRLPPRRAKGGTEWGTEDLVMWIAKGAGIADLIELVRRPIQVSPAMLANNADLIALTKQLQQQAPRSNTSGRER